MRELQKAIESVRTQLPRYRNAGLNEYSTRIIVIDPILEALGWHVRDPDEVDLERPTVDGKAVDYAMKINRKPVLLIEAKQLADPLDDVKAITQVVGYAANDGVEWCVLTNGIRYKVYKVSEKASAPEKLLFEVSLDPRDSAGLSVEQVTNQLNRLSRDSIAQGVLDQLGRQIFTTGKVRKALDHLFLEAPGPLIRLVRRTMDDDTVTPSQIQQALMRIWDSGELTAVIGSEEGECPIDRRSVSRGPGKYSESHHTGGKPREVIELYRGLDRLCQDLAPGRITRAYKAKYVSWSLDKAIFCCAHLQRSGLRVWVKTDPKALDPSESFARDVSKIGHWGVGDVELAIDSLERLDATDKFIRESFRRATAR